jgi:hypothetical protein
MLVIKEENNKPKEQQLWSDSYLVDNLKQQLALIEQSKSKIPTDLLDRPNHEFCKYFCLISNRHYVNQALHYLKIGVLSPIPDFLVSLSDLSPKIVKELALLDKKDRAFVLKQWEESSKISIQSCIITAYPRY